MKQNTRFFVWPDTHLPYHDPVAVDLALKILGWFEPHVVVILGDFLDCAPVSHWLKENRKSSEGLRLAKDFALGNRLLDDIVNISGCEKLVFLEGNHEAWIDHAINKNPELEGLIDLDIGLKFKERRENGLSLVHLKYGKVWNLGKHLYFTHGTYTNMHHAKKHVESYGRSIVYGHVHDVSSYVKVSPIDIEDKHIGLSMGCLSSKNPEFMRNRPNNWVHAVGVGTVRKDDTFSVEPIILAGGQATVGKESFRASKKGWK